MIIVITCALQRRFVSGRGKGGTPKLSVNMWNDRGFRQIALAGNNKHDIQHARTQKPKRRVVPISSNIVLTMTTPVTQAVNKTNQITVVAQPGPLGIYVDEIPGEEYLCIAGLLRNSPLKAEIKAGDRIQGINGVDLKGWTLEKLARYCREHTDSLKSIDILQSSSAKFGFTPRKIKSIAHKKSSPPKSTKLRTKIIRPTPPPMAVFEVLRPPPPFGYERKVLEVPSGRIGIRVKMKNGMLAILEVVDDSPIKHLVQADDVIEGVDSLYEENWDIARFIAYIQATGSRKRTLQMILKTKPPPNPFRLPVPTPQKRT